MLHTITIAIIIHYRINELAIAFAMDIIFYISAKLICCHGLLFNHYRYQQEVYMAYPLQQESSLEICQQQLLFIPIIPMATTFDDTSLLVLSITRSIEQNKQINHKMNINGLNVDRDLFWLISNNNHYQHITIPCRT